jgi:pyridine nucleotide-disulfide oxidoreductase
MATRSFDVVILGGGNAGMGVTTATREAGLTVAMIEPDLLGGTCPNRGCTPKKVLVAAAHALDEIERAEAHHIAVGKPSLNWAALIDREKAMIARLSRRDDAAARRRGDPKPRPLRQPECGGGRRRGSGSQARCDRHRLEAAPATLSRRRTDDHFRRCAERARLARERRVCRGRRHRARIQPCLRPSAS